ncbi:MAG: hypothetical protein E6I99_00975 [Chloroflexi bacterium]|nr:MAG: hypothetical protein E6I99_00975 [Chloroflexota bacterium]
MNTIQPARRKPSAALPASPAAAVASPTADGHLVRGRALIFWDPKIPGKKLDAIDTDQITPADDCVSESLERLDERWKLGAFRYLMPDFRQRVHRGETFVIAGERFGIGSSREMSPAGLKAVAEEAGLEMVIVCGEGIGDIFRRNALNLGLHVVQSRAASEDAQEGDVLAFDPSTRQLTNETRKKRYEPVPLTRLTVASPADSAAPSRSCGRTGSIKTRPCDRAVRSGSGAISFPPLTAPRPFPFTRSIRSPVATRSFHGRRRSPMTTSSSPAGMPTTSRRRLAANLPNCMGSASRTTRRPATASFISISRSRGWSCREPSSPAPTPTAAPTGHMGPSAQGSAARSSASAGRPATSTSRRQSAGGWSSPANCGPGSAARTSCWHCCAAGARRRRKA